jgi:hypothetical protein
MTTWPNQELQPTRDGVPDLSGSRGLTIITASAWLSFFR